LFQQLLHLCSAERSKLVNESDPRVELRKTSDAFLMPSDLPKGTLGDIEHAEPKSPFVAALSGMHLSGIEKNDFSRRRAVNRSSILELFDSGVNETDGELVVPMRCECMSK
jgi:hypothetical protein